MWKITLEEDRLVFTPFFGDPAADQDPDQLREELQDLKLENDRLQQQNEIMRKVLASIACKLNCDECLLYEKHCCRDLSSSLRSFAGEIIDELEDLG